MGEKEERERQRERVCREFAYLIANAKNFQICIDAKQRAATDADLEFKGSFLENYLFLREFTHQSHFQVIE